MFFTGRMIKLQLILMELGYIVMIMGLIIMFWYRSAYKLGSLEEFVWVYLKRFLSYLGFLNLIHKLRKDFCIKYFLKKQKPENAIHI